MSSMEIKFTEAPVKLSASAVQPLTQIVPVGGYRVLDLILSVWSLTGTAPTVDVTIYTSMQDNNEDAWASLGSFAQVTTGNDHKKLTVTGALKYVRYYCALAGTTPVATFEIRGYARTTE